ncbi:hypothetical protein SAMN05444398_103265 [Roseovarius pacificus]|uniref:Uncharacterized protein n=1 Tax=Roseovarius pacificus TaxID=337701 RepID=A0A1M7BJ29_9RHOB|nr:hypothetical protein [Roseovarius pacificus]GGO55177.1 hypothetical protein GCM10011315_17100 [Roseovarius pacificus]SHL54980.1 hypothetical protein SAMN05444398_103265 [Roseovarius pacificus]
MTERNWMEEHGKLEDKLSDVANLVAALQIVSFEIAGATPDRPISMEQRSAVIGISDALERLVGAA